MTTYSWRTSDPVANRSLPYSEYLAGVRDAFAEYNKTFVTQFAQTMAARASIYVIMSPWNLPGGAGAIADRNGVFGYRTKWSIYIDRNRNWRTRNQIKVLVMHELGHLFGAVHTSGRQDIMHINVFPDLQTFSPTDLNQLRRNAALRNVKTLTRFALADDGSFNKFESESVCDCEPVVEELKAPWSSRWQWMLLASRRPPIEKLER